MSAFLLKFRRILADMIEVYPHIFLWNQKIANNGKLAGYTEKRNPSVAISKFTSLIGRIGRVKKNFRVNSMPHLNTPGREVGVMDFRKYCAGGCAVLLWLAAGFGCITPGKKAPVTSGQEAPSIAETQRKAYDGPQARIAVARFKDNTGKGWWSGEMGDGIADQLLTALSNTNRYIVLEKEASGEVLAELDLGTSGHISKQTAARIGQIEGADLFLE